MAANLTSEIKQAKARLARIVAALNAEYHGRDGLPAYLCQTGEPYRVLCSAGWTEEFEPTRMYDTPKRAVDAYLETVGTALAGMTGRLYWRWKPLLRGYNSRGNTPKPGQKTSQWYVSSRLIITSAREKRWKLWPDYKGHPEYWPKPVKKAA